MSGSCMGWVVYYIYLPPGVCAPPYRSPHVLPPPITTTRSERTPSYSGSQTVNFRIWQSELCVFNARLFMPIDIKSKLYLRILKSKHYYLSFYCAAVSVVLVFGRVCFDEFRGVAAGCVHYRSGSVAKQQWGRSATTTWPTQGLLPVLSLLVRFAVLYFHSC